jgi:hypothetical protein
VKSAPFAVEVLSQVDDQVVRSVPCATERAAERVERGIQINLNHDDYYTRIVESAAEPTP